MMSAGVKNCPPEGSNGEDRRSLLSPLGAALQWHNNNSRGADHEGPDDDGGLGSRGRSVSRSGSLRRKRDTSWDKKWIDQVLKNLEPSNNNSNSRPDLVPGKLDNSTWERRASQGSVTPLNKRSATPCSTVMSPPVPDQVDTDGYGPHPVEPSEPGVPQQEVAPARQALPEEGAGGNQMVPDGGGSTDGWQDSQLMETSSTTCETKPWNWRPVNKETDRETRPRGPEPLTSPSNAFMEASSMSAAGSPRSSGSLEQQPCVDSEGLVHLQEPPPIDWKAKMQDEIMLAKCLLSREANVSSVIRLLDQTYQRLLMSEEPCQRRFLTLPHPVSSAASSGVSGGGRGTSGLKSGDVDNRTQSLDRRRTTQSSSTCCYVSSKVAEVAAPPAKVPAAKPGPTMAKPPRLALKTEQGLDTSTAGTSRTTKASKAGTFVAVPAQVITEENQPLHGGGRDSTSRTSLGESLKKDVALVDDPGHLAPPDGGGGSSCSSRRQFFQSMLEEDPADQITERPPSPPPPVGGTIEGDQEQKKLRLNEEIRSFDRKAILKNHVPEKPLPTPTRRPPVFLLEEQEEIMMMIPPAAVIVSCPAALVRPRPSNVVRINGDLYLVPDDLSTISEHEDSAQETNLSAKVEDASKGPRSSNVSRSGSSGSDLSSSGKGGKDEYQEKRSAISGSTPDQTPGCPPRGNKCDATEWATTDLVDHDRGTTNGRSDRFRRVEAFAREKTFSLSGMWNNVSLGFVRDRANLWRNMGDEGEVLGSRPVRKDPVDVKKRSSRIIDPNEWVVFDDLAGAARRSQDRLPRCASVGNMVHPASLQAVKASSDLMSESVAAWEQRPDGGRTSADVFASSGRWGCPSPITGACLEVSLEAPTPPPVAKVKVGRDDLFTVSEETTAPEVDDCDGEGRRPLGEGSLPVQGEPDGNKNGPEVPARISSKQIVTIDPSRRSSQGEPPPPPLPPPPLPPPPLPSPPPASQLRLEEDSASDKSGRGPGSSAAPPRVPWRSSSKDAVKLPSCCSTPPLVPALNIMNVSVSPSGTSEATSPRQPGSSGSKAFSPTTASTGEWKATQGELDRKQRDVVETEKRFRSRLLVEEIYHRKSSSTTLSAVVATGPQYSTTASSSSTMSTSYSSRQHRTTEETTISLPPPVPPPPPATALSPAPTPASAPAPASAPEAKGDAPAPAPPDRRSSSCSLLRASPHGQREVWDQTVDPPKSITVEGDQSSNRTSGRFFAEVAKVEPKGDGGNQHEVGKGSKLDDLQQQPSYKGEEPDVAKDQRTIPMHYHHKGQKPKAVRQYEDMVKMGHSHHHQHPPAPSLPADGRHQQGKDRKPHQNGTSSSASAQQPPPPVKLLTLDETLKDLEATSRQLKEYAESRGATILESLKSAGLTSQEEIRDAAGAVREVATALLKALTPTPDNPAAVSAAATVVPGSVVPNAVLDNVRTALSKLEMIPGRSSRNNDGVDRSRSKAEVEDEEDTEGYSEGVEEMSCGIELRDQEVSSGNVTPIPTTGELAAISDPDAPGPAARRTPQLAPAEPFHGPRLRKRDNPPEKTVGPGRERAVTCPDGRCSPRKVVKFSEGMKEVVALHGHPVGHRDPGPIC